MFNFIKIQFALGKLTAQMVASFVPKFITADEFEVITGQHYEGVVSYGSKTNAL